MDVMRNVFCVSFDVIFSQNVALLESSMYLPKLLTYLFFFFFPVVGSEPVDRAEEWAHWPGPVYRVADFSFREQTDKIINELGTFDFVFSHNVFEHVINPEVRTCAPITSHIYV